MLGESGGPGRNVRDVASDLYAVALERDGLGEHPTDVPFERQEEGASSGSARVTRYFTKKRMKRWGVLAGIVLFFLLSLCIVLYLTYCAGAWVLYNTQVLLGIGGAFRPSGLVAPSEVRSGALETTFAAMRTEWIKGGTKRTCVGAPAVGVFRKMVLLGTSNRVIINPKIVGYGGARRKGHERSLLCPNEEPHEVYRHTKVVVQYIDDASGVQQEDVFTGVDAICLQHYDEVFDGHFRCHD